MGEYSQHADLCTSSNDYFQGGDAPSDSENEMESHQRRYELLQQHRQSGDGRLTPCSSNSQELCIPDPYSRQRSDGPILSYQDFKDSNPFQVKRHEDRGDVFARRNKPELPRGVRLGSSWTYWYIISEGSEEDWKEGMKPMCTFDYKEQFWGMWNAIKPPSELTSKRELALFRGGFGRRPVWPDWNDAENIEGGRWKIIFKVTELPQIVDNFWRDLMVHCIEERWVPYSGFVNGVSITVKGQFYRIYVWLCSTRPAYVEFIKERVKELLKDIPCVQIDYVTGNGERAPRASGSDSGKIQIHRAGESVAESPESQDDPSKKPALKAANAAE